MRSVFEDAYNYMKSGQLLRQVINKLNAIDFNRQAERHQFNDLYEKILRDLQSAGNAGEFYTPRAVTQFMVDMVNPQLGRDGARPRVRHRRLPGLHARAPAQAGEERAGRSDAAAQHPRRGEEAAAAPAVHDQHDAARHRGAQPTSATTTRSPARCATTARADRVDVIVTNPPFGGMEEHGIENNFPADVRTKETADLFLVLIKHLLKPGGRGAHGPARRHAVRRGREDAHQGAAARRVQPAHHRAAAQRRLRPYTGIKTNLLFFTKGEPTQGDLVLRAPVPGGRARATTRPSRSASRSSRPKRPGGAARPMALRAAWRGEFAWKVGIEAIKASRLQPRPEEPACGARG